MYCGLAWAGAGHPEIGQPLCVECQLLLLAAAGAARIGQHGRASNGDGRSPPRIFSAGLHAIRDSLSSGLARCRGAQPLLAQLAEAAIANAGADLPHQVEQKGDVVQADQPDA